MLVCQPAKMIPALNDYQANLAIAGMVIGEDRGGIEPPFELAEMRPQTFR